MLGHGTFLRGLETKATNDPCHVIEEFILESFSLSTYKWCISHHQSVSILYLYSCCCNYPNVILTNYTFLVYLLRSEETNEPLPGVTVGEIGHQHQRQRLLGREQSAHPTQSDRHETPAISQGMFKLMSIGCTLKYIQSSPYRNLY